MMQTSEFDKYPPLIPAPDDHQDWAAWLAALTAWRDRVSPLLDRPTYDQPEFAWMRRCYVCGKVMLFDREFYDEGANRFKVAAYLERMRREFGGLDALVLWQAYPRIGIDERNQFDHYRLVPGLKAVVAELHAQNVRVFMAYNPWDVGTRREGLPDSEVLASVVKEFGFDGIFLDTLQEGPAALRKSLDASRPGVVMESELALPVQGIPMHHASWAQWLDDSEAPGILRNRWVEPRHMMHLIRRWDLDHSGELHTAWMNGAGMLVWENVFGSWNGWSDRDKAILRAMSPVRRRYADLFAFGKRHPLVECSLAGSYAGLWEREGLRLWTFVNRSVQPLKGTALPISHDGQTLLFDLIRGVELDHVELELSPRGVGAVLAIPRSQVDAGFRTFLAAQAEEYRRSANEYAIRTEPLVRRVSASPETGEERKLVSRLRARECGEYGYYPYPNLSYPPLHFERRFEEIARVSLESVEAREVTNGEFLAFVKATGYRPAVADSFLVHWVDGKPRTEDLERPVVFVDLNDARAYARWAKKRLPTEFEWQAAVAGRNLAHGEVWNWTESEHFDGHTRFSILKGGCRWRSQGSPWYTESGPQPADWSTKLIHFYPGLDRSATIGFRCAGKGMPAV